MNQKRNKTKVSLFAFEVVLVLALAIAGFMTKPYLLAITLGLIVAVLTNPSYQWLKKKVSAKWSAFVIVLFVLIVIVGPLTTLGIVAVKQGLAIGKQVASDDHYTVAAITDSLYKWPPIKAFADDRSAFEEQVRGALESAGKGLSGILLIQASALPDIIVQLILALVTCFFFLLDGPVFMKWLRDRIPLEKDIQQALIQSFENTSVSVIRAILAAASAQTFIIVLGFLILRVPGAALGAGATFILSWVPVIGCSPVWLAASAYLYFQGSLARSLLMLLVGMFATVADNIIRPLMLRGTADLHPLVSLLAIIGGLHFFGLIGVFLGPIIIAVVVLLLQIWPMVARRAEEEMENKI
jgi:predicted PurR-regulated permease PerM